MDLGVSDCSAVIAAFIRECSSIYFDIPIACFASRQSRKINSEMLIEQKVAGACFAIIISNWKIIVICGEQT